MPITFFSSLKITTSTMSAATDKARFFLEQSVPELKEYERKKLFTKVGTTLVVRLKLGLRANIDFSHS
jgi:hypothetical protein